MYRTIYRNWSYRTKQYVEHGFGFIIHDHFRNIFHHNTNMLTRPNIEVMQSWEVGQLLGGN